MEYFVYILKCNDDSYYAGITNDIERRYNEHSMDINPRCYTYNKRPLNLMFCEAFNNPTQAIDFEKKIKGWSRLKKEALINKNWEKLIVLASCNNITSHKHHRINNATSFDSAQDDSSL
jgi:putative endonuclease